MRSLATASALAALVMAAAAAAKGPASFDRAGMMPAADSAARGPAPLASRPAPRVRPALPAAAPTLSPLHGPQRAEAVARDALAADARRLGIPQTAIDDAVLREIHDTGTGPVIARFGQWHNGLEVHGREASVVMDRDYRPVAVSGGFSTHVKGAARSRVAEFRLPAAEATALALRDLAEALPARRVPLLRLVGAAPRVVPVYYADRARLVPAWRLALRAAQIDGAGTLAYGYLVSAEDGAILARGDLTREINFSYRAHASSTFPFTPHDGPLGNGRTPFPNANYADDPARVAAAPAMVTLQNGPISTGDPWLTDGASQLRGNNVDAYPDVTSPDGVSGDGYVPTNGTRTFNYPSAADADPATVTARRAGATNLFYVINWLHDAWYDRGFNEAAGNAQANNYGRGGRQADAMLAESQDFAGFNNARMYTPPDGERPVMEMFLFDGSSGTLTVTQPALGAMAAGLASFGPTTFDLTDDVGLANDGVVPVTDGCGPITGISGRIALIDRGDCLFTEKVKNAQNAGATGAVVANNLANDGPAPMGGADGTVTIPAMSVSLEDGDTLKAAIASGTTLVRLRRTAGFDRDSALDNGIVTHEFFHHVSDRLVGDGFGLVNNQARGLGEGWSDFAALLLAVRPDDVTVAGNSTFAGAYGFGFYVDNSAYFGPRRAPYSTDFGYNPLTFKHIADGEPLPQGVPLQYGGDGSFNSEVHATGEIWGNVLWETYAALLNDPRYTPEQARTRMMDYVIAGLKATPVVPTFLDARDALLAVALATDAQDHALMAGAFAKRGMGVGAVGPEAWSTDHGGITESYIALAAAYAVTAVELDHTYDDGTLGFCDTDQILDVGETALLSVVVQSTGSLPLAAGATVQLASGGDFTLPDGGVLTLPALALGEAATVSVPVSLNSAAATAQAVTVTATFPEAGGTPDAVIEPAPLSQRLELHYDLQKNRAADDVELEAASVADWAVALSAPVGPAWRPADVDAAFGTGRAWHGADNNGEAISTLTSPPFAVAGAFSMSFQHFFDFEEDPDSDIEFDGGVIEVSTNGGTAWTDVLTFGATFTQGNAYNGVAEAFDDEAHTTPRPAFVDTNGALESMTLSFGNLLAGKGNVRLRFRLDTDTYVADFGWLVDNVVFTGATGAPFSGAVAENGACANRPPHANAGANQAVAEGSGVTLSGSALDRDGAGGLTYQWTRLSGPAVTLTGAATPTAQFTAPSVGSNTSAVFRLTVGDGTAQSFDDVTVTIQNTVVDPPAAAPGGGGGGGGALGSGVSLLGLLALLRRRLSRCRASGATRLGAARDRSGAP
jgi:hypothetical protein